MRRRLAVNSGGSFATLSAIGPRLVPRTAIWTVVAQPLPVGLERAPAALRLHLIWRRT